MAWRVKIPCYVSLELHHLLLLGIDLFIIIIIIIIIIITVIIIIIIILYPTRKDSVLPYPSYIHFLIKFATALPSIRHNDKV